MTKNKNYYLQIFVFLAAIFIPLGFSNKVGGKISPTENRALAEFPVFFSSDFKLNLGIRSGIENWINDNVGGRTAAITINKTITYKLFGVFPEENFVEGKDGWLFYLPPFDIPNSLNTILPSTEQIGWLTENFSRLTADFKTCGMEYTVMIWPNKYNIYPEYMPTSLVSMSKISAIELLDEYLSINPNFDFQTPLSELLNQKVNQQIYYKAYDRSHWNGYGAFIGYTELMKQAQRHLPELRILNEDDFTITPVNRNTFTSWGYQSHEEDFLFMLKDGLHASSDLSFFTSFEFNSHDPWKSYNYFINSDDSLPKAVVIGDSFIWMFLLPNIAESFSELVFINYLDLDQLGSIINLIKPDIVINAASGPGPAYTFASYQFSATNCGNPQN